MQPVTFTEPFILTTLGPKDILPSTKSFLGEVNIHGSTFFKLKADFHKKNYKI